MISRDELGRERVRRVTFNSWYRAICFTCRVGKEFSLYLWLAIGRDEGYAFLLMLWFGDAILLLGNYG